MGAPAHLGGLAALRDEAVDRPGVDELADLLGLPGDLGVALGDMDHAHAEVACQLAPALPSGGLHRAQAGVLGEVDQRLLHEMRDQAGVGAVGDHRRRPAAVLRHQLQHVLAQRIVGAQRHRQAGVGIAARPGLDAGVDIEGALLLAELDQGRRGDLDRQVDHEVALGHSLLERLAEVVARQALPDEGDAELLQLLQAAAVLGRDDRDLLGLDVDVPEDQRQHALADRAEADHDHAARERGVLLGELLLALARDFLRHFQRPCLYPIEVDKRRRGLSQGPVSVSSPCVSKGRCRRHTATEGS